MKISKHLCLFILVVPCLFSCSFDKPSSESMERVKIDNAIASFSILYQRTSVRLSTPSPKVSTYCDFKGELIEALKGINYQEIKKQNNKSNPAYLNFGNGDGYIMFTLYRSLDYITITDMVDSPFSLSGATRYYHISQEEGQMLSDTAFRIKEEYDSFLETGGNIEDYKALGKAFNPQFQLPNNDIKTDYDHVIFDTIKTAEHIETTAPIEEEQYALSYDINNGNKYGRDFFYWRYYLLDDYQTVHLDFFYEYEVDTYDTVTKKRSYYYQISEAIGRSLVNVAKGANTLEN